MSKEDDSERDDGHLVLPQASLNRTTMTMVETRAGEDRTPASSVYSDRLRLDCQSNSRVATITKIVNMK